MSPAVDAVGGIDPATGGGIAWAIDSRHRSGLAAAAALAAGDPGRAALLHWRRMARMRGELARVRRLAQVVHRPRLQARCPDLPPARPGLQRWFLDLVAGRMDCADLSLRSLLRIALGLARRG